MSEMEKKNMAAVVFAVMMMVVVMLGSLVEFSIAGEVYKVGDSLGWTIMGNPNYTAWAQSKTFQVGDVILFEYNKQFHNVVEVTKSDYKSCNAVSPLATYTSGNDSVAIKRRGHHFFLCGVPGHCQIGQKVDVRIPKLAIALGPSVSASAPPTPSTPASNLGSSSGGSRLWLVAVLMMVVVGVGLV